MRTHEAPDRPSWQLMREPSDAASLSAFPDVVVGSPTRVR